MTRRQLMSLYRESFRVEARESQRLFFIFRHAQIQVDAKSYLQNLQQQAFPPDPEEAEAIGLSGFEKAKQLWGGGVRADDVGTFVDLRKKDGGRSEPGA